MTSFTHHSQSVRQRLAVLAGVLAATMPVMATVAMPATVGAAGEYVNASIADKALEYVGQWGGEACIDSRKPGDSGGQCRSFVNCVVWMASNGTQNLGGRDYFRTFLAAGAQEIASIDELQKGDIVQEGQGRHTFIIVSRVSGNVFNVVDSNHRWNEKVSNYDRAVTLNYSKRAFRMGLIQPQVAAAAATKPMVGALDSLEAANGGTIARGWVIDADVTRPTYAQLFAGSDSLKPEDGKSLTVKADDLRMDVAATHTRYGSSHGFRAFIPLPAGTHVICLYGVNAPDTPGENTKLGCKAVTVQQQ